MLEKSQDMFTRLMSPHSMGDADIVPSSGHQCVLEDFLDATIEQDSLAQLQTAYLYSEASMQLLYKLQDNLHNKQELAYTPNCVQPQLDHP